MKKNILLIILIFVVLCSSGQTVTPFAKTYGLIGYNYGKCAYQTDDGGYIILGNKSGFVGNTDIYLIKTDTAGEIIWDKAIGGADIEWANDFKVTHDKGLIIAGYTNAITENGYDVLLIKTDSSGTIEWSKTFGGADWDMGYSVIEDKDHNFLLAGESFSNSFGDADVYLIKTNSFGDTIWTRHYGGTGSDIAYSIDTTNFSDYLISGVTREISDSTYDAYLLKISNTGDTLMTRKYGDIYDDKFYCARQFDDTTYIICGTTNKFDITNYDAWLLKTDTLGNIKWTISSAGSPGDEECFDIKRSWNNDIVDIGYSSSIGAGKKDLTFSINGSAGSFGGAEDEVGYSVNLTKDSCYIFTGTTNSFGLGITNIYFIKTNKTGSAPPTPTQETVIYELDNNKNDLSIFTYPNPTKGLVNINLENFSNGNIQIKVFNAIGMELFMLKDKITNSLFCKNITIAEQPDGIYFIQVSSDNTTSTTKIIKQSSK